MGAPVVGPVARIVRAGGGAAAVVVLLVSTGCGATGVRPTPASSASGSASASASPSPGAPTPVDGYGLRTFGIQNGPAQFSVPRGSVASTVVDQANNVVLVLSAPSGAEIGEYLRRTLPGSGFTVTDDDPADDTLTFIGHDWTGSFTSADGASAVLLRPVTR